MFLIYGSKITVLFKRFHPAAEHYFKDVTPPPVDDLEPGKLLLERGRQWTSMEGNSAPGASQRPSKLATTEAEIGGEE